MSITTLLPTKPPPPVLNPAMRFLWIQSEWETKYIQNAKDIVLKLISTIYFYIGIPYLSYLVQMNHYRGQKSPAAATEVLDSSA